MKKKILFLAIAVTAFTLLSCGGSAEKQSTKPESVEVAESAKVMVYYFHGKQRCKTCLAIQKVAEQTINEKFAENKDVKFIELDYSDKANEALVEKYQVANSSLIIVSGDGFTDLTNIAFANAIRNPNELKEKIVAEVNNYLNQ
ncbi:MAG: nitrophenyl compound nitroreductase subunit ArsF family protein [Bacteroidales bacterium]|jgi:ABC-type glycerol-3-phosphate transport system substrate-binding protein|nr:nitrophenyl compound nitroreductase subunit ArsF family protein [Bacteroidales bacterium]MDD4385711.1 nitrophenyl compound nitroreductase subunit ArsF family protein [Bacteroidales bacterium]MDY0197955.1 nitrophenyl compound nitroreductase subunit ArsF family protein [Tenuifilaceae bacterium]